MSKSKSTIRCDRTGRRLIATHLEAHQIGTEHAVQNFLAA